MYNIYMNILDTSRRAAIVRCLVEGNSIRSTVRITGASKNTIAKLLVELGHACAEYQDRTFCGIVSERIQCDEIWSFVSCKEKNLPQEERGQFGRGDVWTWTALDSDTKLMVSWLVGQRNPECAAEFMNDLAARLVKRVQLTTDGLKCYLTAVKGAFDNDIDYAMLIKVYGNEPEGQKRYSPAKYISADHKPITGEPDDMFISTSHVERQNLTMRMGMRRFTRLTNAFSKKTENHACAIALHFMYYNFARVHQTLKTTPAIAAGVADHAWTIEEIIGILP